MCRNIKKLRVSNRPPTDEELHDAALQFIRKISGYPKPSQSNRKVFDRAVREVARAGRKMFENLEVRPAPERRAV
ncbi:MAG: DUF2277 domain-containing protein [Ignavibacteria bacterium]|nr:DUF2277 domain-containing protein [Ignavibacteria bacterium]